MSFVNHSLFAAGAAELWQEISHENVSREITEKVYETLDESSKGLLLNSWNDTFRITLNKRLGFGPNEGVIRPRRALIKRVMPPPLDR
jgi:hypothetical protein